MSCRNCRSQVLDTWLYCPKCGQPTPLATGRPTDDPSLRSPDVSPVSPAQILDRLDAGVLLVTPRGRIGHINAAARALFKIPANQNLLGKPCTEFIRHEEVIAVIKRHLATGFQPTMAKEAEDTQKPEVISITDSQEQECFYQVLASHVYDDANTSDGTVFMFKDISEQRHTECLQAAFISIVHQRVGWLLIPVQGFIRTLLDNEKEEAYDLATRHEFYTIIEENVDRAHKVIGDLLNLAHLEQMAPVGIKMYWEEKVSLRKLMEQVLESQHGRTDKHTFVIDFAPEDIEFETDPDKTRTILENLVSNALKYSPNGGEVRFTARRQPGDAHFPYGSVSVGVTDQGVGISSQELRKLHQMLTGPRRSERRSVNDTAMGLYLVKALVAAHLGVMTVDSEPGKGSTFEVRLPLRGLSPDESILENQLKSPLLFGSKLNP